MLGAAVALSACADDRPREREPHDPAKPFHPPIEILQRYVTNQDGSLTRAQLEAGLKTDFAAADTNHDGRLDGDETRAVNEQRWSENASTTSTLVDWNQDGFVDFNEFAGTARSLFAELDSDGDGVLTPKEMGRKQEGPAPAAAPAHKRRHSP
ncbi:MAG TPA: EF-hand domain-containing protein [Rhizomicrobium sp.]|nr:EF-hand domain-containing protein [Rhizomicrobium sp.]